MALKLIPSASRLPMVAGLVFGAAAAQAVVGFTVTHAQEALVSPGMSMEQVRQTLGHPERSIQYRNEPGPTFTYRVMSNDPTLFNVDFSADGRVVSTNERMDLTGGRGGGHR